MVVQLLALKNLKSYKDAIMLLSKGINLLVGANNSGKSTIIKALLNLQYGVFEQKDIRCDEFCAEVSTNITDITEAEYFKHFYQEETHRNYPVCSAVKTIHQFNRKRIDQYNCADSSHLTIKKNKKDLASKENVETIKFTRFSDSENANNFIYPFLAKRKTDYYDTTISKDQTYRVSDSLRNLAAKIQKISNPSHPKNGEFNRLCDEILGFRIGVVALDQEGGNGIETGIYVDGTTSISIRNMGDGVANIIGFIVILLTENNKLFLIEELENDIHPKALKRLLSLIVEKSAQNQFVISTHSHIVVKHLGAMKNSKVFYVDWKANEQRNNTTYNIPTSTIDEIENKAENRIKILERLGYDFFDFELYASYLILEESTAEKVIRDFLIPNIVPSLYDKIKTIAAKGVSDLEARVNDFTRLFVYIHTNPIYFKKSWVIADGDESGKSCIISLQERFKTWPTDHFLNFSKENFEEYYPDRFQSEVAEVLSIKHGVKKQEAKSALLQKVMKWSLQNRVQAVEEFSNSANEVISILRKIEKKINKN